MHSSPELLDWLKKRASKGGGVVGAFANRVCEGETWLLDAGSTFHDKVSIEARAAALAEWSRSQSSSRRRGSRKSSAGASAKQRVVRNGCAGCGHAGAGLVVVRDKAKGQTRHWHRSCLDRSRGTRTSGVRGPEGLRIRGRANSAGGAFEDWAEVRGGLERLEMKLVRSMSSRPALHKVRALKRVFDESCTS
jgi:hypothetical protein